jgi:hypothetical protein
MLAQTIILPYSNYLNDITMTTTVNMPSRQTIILVGLVGCFLTSVAGVTGAMLISGWQASGGGLEWLKRLALGYPCACLVVLGVFPVLVPRLTQRLEAKRVARRHND